MTSDGYRFVRALLPEELAQKCDAYRNEHHLSWDALVVIALRRIVDPPRRTAHRGSAWRKVPTTTASRERFVGAFRSR